MTEIPTRSPMTQARFAAAAGSHRGLVRRVNEDSHLERTEIGLWLVADGVGGANAGDWASRCIVETFQNLKPPDDAPQFLVDVRNAIEQANARLLAHAEEIGGMVASTVVVLMVYGWHYTCLWLGDSRGYLVRDGALTQITRDHSEVQELLDAGAITAEQAMHHPRGNVITRAVGASEAPQPDRISGILRPGDRFLLCTDGLTKMVEEAPIAALMAEKDLQSIPGSLIAAALAHGGHDNVTVVAVQCDAPAESALHEERHGSGV
jgi:serine/threonine protein phosphatase Stp1